MARRRNLAVLALAVGGLLTFRSSPTRADAPKEVSFQARLTQASGQPILDGPVAKVTFRLFSDEALVTSSFLWGEVHTNVIASRGIITVRLGHGAQAIDASGNTTNGMNPLDPALFADGTRYMQVQVNGDVPLKPAIAMVSVPYSLSTGSFNGKPEAQISPIGAVIDWFRPSTSTPIPQGWKICDGTVVDDTDDPQKISPFRGQGPVPDLQGRFVRGISKTQLATYGAGSPLEAAGVDSVDVSHSHTTQSSQHTHSFATSGADGAHGHTGNTDQAALNSVVGAGAGFAFVSGFQHTHPVTSIGGGTHSHSGTTASATTGGEQTSTYSYSFDNRPAYVGLLKIIRVW